jgi:hypothetical protein
LSVRAERSGQTCLASLIQLEFHTYDQYGFCNGNQNEFFPY